MLDRVGKSLDDLTVQLRREQIGPLNYWTGRRAVTPPVS